MGPALPYSAAMPATARPQRRMTWSQLVMVLIVVGVVVAAGIPLAHEHALRRERWEAMRTLTRIERAEESYLVEHGRYAAAREPPPAGLGLPARSASGRYDITVELGDPTGSRGFIAQARSRRPDRDPQCVLFTLDQHGVRGARDAGGADRTDSCWR